MPYAFIQDVPADKDMYRLIRAKLPTEAPKGLASHVVVEREDGRLRYIDVWESEADWERFRDECVEPAWRGPRRVRPPPRPLDRHSSPSTWSRTGRRIRHPALTGGVVA